MYSTEYCDDPEAAISYLIADPKYDDSIGQEYREKLTALDRYLFLIDSYLIICDCSKDLLEIIPEDKTFWKVNKCLINYVNSVYYYHEYVNSYKPSLTTITNSFYCEKNGNRWYRFICDYRNRIIHQSLLLRDYNRHTRNIYISLESLLRTQTDYLDYLRSRIDATDDEKQRKKIKSQINNTKRFIKRINDLILHSPLESKGFHYWSIKTLANDAQEEIDRMNNKILLYVFKELIAPIIQWLISLIVKEDDIHKYTFIVNKEISDSEMEPNFDLEYYFKELLFRLGNKHPIIHMFIELLNENGYNYFYDGNCFIEDFIANTIETDL